MVDCYTVNSGLVKDNYKIIQFNNCLISKVKGRIVLENGKIRQNSNDEIEMVVNNGYYLFALRLVYERMSIYGETTWLRYLINKYKLKIEYLDEAKKKYPYLNKVDFQTKNEMKFEYSNIDDYVVNHNDDGKISIPPPLNGKQHYIFNQNEFERPTRDIIKIPNAYISVDFTKPYAYDYYIFDGNGNYLEEISVGRQPFILRDDIVTVNKNVGFIEDKFTKFNICHLLFDKIPRIYELSRQFNDIDEFLLFSKNKYIDDLALALNFNITDMSKFNGLKITVKFPMLYLTSSSSYSKRHPGQIGYEYFHQAVSKITNTAVSRELKSSRKLFISREKAKTRRILNNEQVTKTLEGFGFEIVDLEDYSLNEKIVMFQSASVVIGVYGAGLTHVVFCQAGTKIIEILPAKCATPTYWIASRVCNLDYDSFIENSYDSIDYDNWFHDSSKYNQDDLMIDIESFKELLHKKLLCGTL